MTPGKLIFRHGNYQIKHIVTKEDDAFIIENRRTGKPIMAVENKEDETMKLKTKFNKLMNERNL